MARNRTVELPTKIGNRTFPSGRTQVLDADGAYTINPVTGEYERNPALEADADFDGKYEVEEKEKTP